MPELPEVETTRKGIKPYIHKKRVSDIIVRQPKLRWPVPPEIHQMEGQTVDSVRSLGPEPLTDDFNANYLYQASRGRSMSIKQFIMNGHVVVGVGNIYACESLFMSGISPKWAAGRVSKKRYELFVENIKTVLSNAIEQGGTTLKDFVQVEGTPGYFAQELNTYGRAGEPCFQCASPIKQITQGQRSTFYCSKCQR